MAADTLFQFHETRISRLEESTSDIGAQLAQHGERIDHVAGRVDEAREVLGEKLDRLDAKLDAQDEQRHHLDARVAKLEGGAARWSATKKALLGLVIGGAAVAVKELVVLLLHHFTA